MKEAESAYCTVIIYLICSLSSRKGAVFTTLSGLDHTLYSRVAKKSRRKQKTKKKPPDDVQTRFSQLANKVAAMSLTCAI